MDSEAQKKQALYFTALAPEYARSTGNTTRTLLADLLDEYGNRFSIDNSSIIHDNACGPGTATEALLKWFAQEKWPLPTITATDSSPAMIEAIDKIKLERAGWSKVNAQVMDSHKLTFSEYSFTHVICNFSIFNMADPLETLKEIHRTLKPKGIVVVSCWKRFGVAEVMRAAQKIVKGDNAAPLEIAGAEFLKEGYLANLVDRSGFESGKIRTLSKMLVLRDSEDLKGIHEFMTGKFSQMARVGWTDEENAKWPDAVSEALEAEKKKHGGLLMEAWMVFARKWDEITG